MHIIEITIVKRASPAPFNPAGIIKEAAQIRGIITAFSLNIFEDILITSSTLLYSEERKFVNGKVTAHITNRARLVSIVQENSLRS